MSFIFGKKPQANQAPAISGLQLQSSAYGRAIPIIYGSARVAPNLIWYGDFVAIPQESSPASGGGKGGVGGGGGGKGGGGSVQYIYQTAVAMALCEGAIQSIGTIWINKNITSSAALGLSEFLGTYPQSPWTYLSTNHPTEALGYNGIAYLAAAAYQLGNSAQLPNHNVEIKGIYSNSISGRNDADPSLVVADILTNVHYGVSFPSSKIGDLSLYQSYVLATGLWISAAYDQQTQAAAILSDIAKATNSEWVATEGVLKLIPYGDEVVTGNGHTYTPPTAPLFDLNDNDFVMLGSSPVKITRKRISDAENSLKLEYFDRNNSYNPAIVEAKEQAAIDAFGLRQGSTLSAHVFADGDAARLSAQLQLQRQFVLNHYEFATDQRYIVLDPMDVVTLTDSVLGLDRQAVRIKTISEDEAGNLVFHAEDYLEGVSTAALYDFQPWDGFEVNYNASPGDVNAPVIFEPTAALAESLQIWMALSGGAIWGGADVYISSDGSTYKLIGRITGNCRTGVLSADLPAYTQAVTGVTIDQTNTLSIDVSESRAELLPGTQSDALQFSTACYVDGEIVSYQDADLVGAYAYDLSYLGRGGYDTPISAHLAGTQFARIDENILKFSYTADRVGQTIAIKFLSFNIYGGGLGTLAEATPFYYTIKGTALSSALPTVQNARLTFVAGISQITWDEVEDFRVVTYEVRKGAEPLGAQLVGRYAHPPFNVLGNDTYWIAAYTNPAPGIEAYSENWVSVEVSGATLTQNVIATHDERATGWDGAFSGNVGHYADFIATFGAGDLFTAGDILSLSDVLGYGGFGSGYYEIPVAHQISIGRTAPCNVLIDWIAVGQYPSLNFLDYENVLSLADIFQFSASANFSVYPKIATSEDGVTWTDWQKYVAGAYIGNYYKARLYLQSFDPTVQAIAEEFVFSVDVPDRIDNYTNIAVSSGGTTINFTPNGSATPAPFNGGTQGSPTIPSVQGSIINANAGDDLIISALSLSSVTLHIKNGGSFVSGTASLIVQGY